MYTMNCILYNTVYVIALQKRIIMHGFQLFTTDQSLASEIFLNLQLLFLRLYFFYNFNQK